MPEPSRNAAEVEVPEEWRAIGFSGLFHTEAAIQPEEIDLWRSRVPCMVPLGTNSGWLALRVNTDRPSVTIVRKDEDAIVDIGTGRLKPKEDR